MQVFLFVYIMVRTIFQLLGWMIKAFLYVLWIIFWWHRLPGELSDRTQNIKPCLEGEVWLYVGVSINHLIAR